jgi:coenzyme F420-0:L-glutamate ligase/coenzyme F420-1:gamma-L-glutamate ligase
MSVVPAPIRLLPLSGIPAVQSGDDLPKWIAESAQRAAIELANGILVVCQKIVSKAEGRVVKLEDVEPSEDAIAMAQEDGRDPREMELVLNETRRIVLRGHGVTISETHHGFVCANAGVDRSNAPAPDTAVLLPTDPDASARALRAALLERGARPPLAVIVSDSFGRPWREGLVDVALGCAGIGPIWDCRGGRDLIGRPLTITILARADQLAAAAGLMMSKHSGIPAVWIEGVSVEGEGSVRETLRGSDTDLFR